MSEQIPLENFPNNSPAKTTSIQTKLEEPSINESPLNEVIITNLIKALQDKERLSNHFVQLFPEISKEKLEYLINFMSSNAENLLKQTIPQNDLAKLLIDLGKNDNQDLKQFFEEEAFQYFVGPLFTYLQNPDNPKEIGVVLTHSNVAFGRKEIPPKENYPQVISSGSFQGIFMGNRWDIFNKQKLPLDFCLLFYMFFTVGEELKKLSLNDSSLNIKLYIVSLPYGIEKQNIKVITAMSNLAELYKHIPGTENFDNNSEAYLAIRMGALSMSAFIISSWFENFSKHTKLNVVRPQELAKKLLGKYIKE